MLELAQALSAALVAMGGWAVVTVKELPEYFVAGRQYTIEFQVRQHGRTLLSGLHPRLVINSSSREITVPAVARPAEGTYAVTFTVPTASQVILTIRSGFGNSDLRLYPIPIVTAGASRTAMAPADRGQMLFIAKGCNTCHANSDLMNPPDNQSLTIGPSLGGRHLAAAVVIAKVKNPASQVMPDLGLTDTEASAIAAFLNDQATTSGR